MKSIYELKCHLILFMDKNVERSSFVFKVSFMFQIIMKYHSVLKRCEIDLRTFDI